MQQQVPDSRFALRPINYQARLLGAMVGSQQEDCQSWDAVTLKIKEAADRWSGHSLSLRGKVLIAKTLLLSQTTFLLHVQDMPVAVAKKLDRLIALFIWGTNRQEFASRDSIQASSSTGGLDVPSISLWRQAIWRSMLRKLSRPSFWSTKLSQHLVEPRSVFKAFASTAELPVCRRPKELMSSLRPAFPVEKLCNRTNSLLTGTTTVELQDSLPIRTSRRANRKVFDVRWRCLTDCAVSLHPATLCPHCSEPDSTRHRFWDCRVAQEERRLAHRYWPALATIGPTAALLFPPDTHLVHSDALLWRLHLLALWKMNILKRPPAALSNFVAEFGRQ